MRAGNSAWYMAREIVMRPDSSGSRSASSAGRRIFGQFVEKQHAMRGRARPRLAAAARRRRPALPPMRCGAARARCAAASGRDGSARPGSGCAADSSASCCGERWHQAGQALRQHRSCRCLAGRPAAGCGRRRRPARARAWRWPGRGRRADRAAVRRSRPAVRPWLAAAHRRAEGRSLRRIARTTSSRCAARRQTQAVDQRRLVGAAGRQHQRTLPAPLRCSDNAIASAPRTGRSSPASDSSPANSCPARRAGIDLSAGGQDAEGDRQVEASRILRQIGRRQADGDALVVRKLEAAVLQRRADPFARLLDLGIGQSDQREARQAVGQVHLDGDGGRIDAQQGAAVQYGERHGGRSSHR